MHSFLTEEQILGKNGVMESYIKTKKMCNIQIESYEACLKELNDIVQEEIYTFTTQSDKTIIKFSIPGPDRRANRTKAGRIPQSELRIPK